MRIFGAAILATTLLVTNAFAATLPVGKPAGVKKAQMGSQNTLLIIGGIGLAGLGIGLAASSNGGGPSAITSAPISTSTGTAGSTP
ncbi:MAG TPA: hypothetical protein VK515_08820 [Rhizomicrobium sp.]|nr:hypothetical protein [Rhizomicrobium sp.]